MSRGCSTGQKGFSVIKPCYCDLILTSFRCFFAHSCRKQTNRPDIVYHQIRHVKSHTFIVYTCKALITEHDHTRHVKSYTSIVYICQAVITEHHYTRHVKSYTFIVYTCQAVITEHHYTRHVKSDTSIVYTCQAVIIGRCYSHVNRPIP